MNMTRPFSKRRLNRWAQWLLPLIALRALVPAGFMLSVDAEGLALAFCSGEIAVATQQQAGHEHQHGAQHDTGGHGEDSSHSAQEHVPCPYSLTASATPFETPHLAGVALIPCDDSADRSTAFTPTTGPLRADRIRGPPHLS
jgi:hypothetical protein